MKEIRESEWFNENNGAIPIIKESPHSLFGRNT